MFPPVLLVMFAGFQWGLAGGLASLLMREGWAPEVLSFWRCLVGLICMVIWLGVETMRGERLMAPPRMMAWAVVAGLGVTGNFTFYFISISEGSVAVAVTLMYSAPVMVYLLAFLTGVERVTGVKLLIIALVMAGIVLLTGVYKADPEGVTLIGVAAGLLAGLSYAAFIFGFKSASVHGSAPSALSVAFLVSTLALLPLIDRGQAASVPLSPDFVWIGLLGLLGAGLSFWLYFYGLRWVVPTTASIVAMIEPVTAALFGVLVLHDRLAAVETAGMVIILGAVTAMSLLRTAPRDA